MGALDRRFPAERGRGARRDLKGGRPRNPQWRLRSGPALGAPHLARATSSSPLSASRWAASLGLPRTSRTVTASAVSGMCGRRSEAWGSPASLAAAWPDSRPRQCSGRADESDRPSLAAPHRHLPPGERLRPTHLALAVVALPGVGEHSCLPVAVPPAQTRPSAAAPPSPAPDLVSLLRREPPAGQRAGRDHDGILLRPGDSDHWRRGDGCDGLAPLRRGGILRV